jgi:hypothetical protein
MSLIYLTIGVAAIFCSGILAHMYRVQQDRRDLIWSGIGFGSGVACLISLIGHVSQ